jgi:uncharacterized protein YggE
MNIANSSGNSVRSLIVASILSPALLCAQTSLTATNSVTVTAAEASTAQPSEAIFLITVNSPFATSVSDVEASVSSLGITQSGLLTVSTTSPSLLAWTFQLITPFSNQKATAAALAALQNGIAQNNSGLSLSFSVSSYGASVTSCNLSSLVANAQSQAQTLAAAAGQSLGNIVGITSAVSNAGLNTCSMIVKFALGFQYFESPPAITIIATQTANTPPPDQAAVTVLVNSGPTTALDDVNSALQTAGIGGATLMAVNTVTNYTTSGNQPQASILWSFGLTTPISKLGTLLGQLSTAVQTFQNQDPTLSLSFYVASASSSQPVSCQEPSLLAMAQTQAQQVAAAAGVHAGAVLSLTTPSLPQAPNYDIFQQGSFTTSTTSTTSSTSPAGVVSSPSTFCTMNAQFQLQ